MRYQKLLFTLIGAVLLLRGTPAAEIDNVTPRGLVLSDSSGQLDRIIAERIEAGVGNANRRTNGIEDDQDAPASDRHRFCDEDLLYTELRKAIFQATFVNWGLKGYELDRQLRELLARHSYRLPLNDSIYRDINYIEGLSLNLKELSDVVNLDGHLVGLDKIGHFFAQGWQYFEIAGDDANTLEDAIAWGQKKEAGLFGYTTTGIYSYADLVANLNGWRFWNRVLLKRDDPLKGFFGRLLDRAYVSCNIQIVESLRRWRLIRAWEFRGGFALRDYLDGAWNEANNCNSYADPMIEAKVMARIARVDPGFSCPDVPASCRRAREKYGAYARYLLHPACLTAR